MPPVIIPDKRIQTASADEVVEQYSKWVWKIVRRYRGALDKIPSIDEDDLYQAGIIGLLKAQERYDPDGGANFMTFSFYYIRSAIQRTLGFDAQGKLPYQPESLDKVIGDDTDITVADTVPDPDIVPFDDALIAQERRDETSSVVREAVDRLKNSKQREIITRCWLNGEKRAAVADDMGINLRALQAVDLEGRHKLWRDEKLREYSIPYFSVGIGRFRTTWTSAVEEAVIWKDEHLPHFLQDLPKRRWSPERHLSYMERMISKRREKTS